MRDGESFFISARLRLAVLISGSGTTLQNIVEHCRDRKLCADVVVVVASRAGIKGIERAREAGIDCHVVERKEFGSGGEFSRRVFSICREAGAELVCMGGWLSLLEIPGAWQGRVMNIHPALLPSFGGAGMYGRRVHQAVLDHGCKVSGCTVHFVDGGYDSGPIILQRCCAVAEGDTAEMLAHRVFEEERIAYPEAIELFGRGRLRVVGRRVRIKAEG